MLKGNPLQSATPLSVSNEKQRNIQTNIEKSLVRIKSFQTANGGFTYWPNSYDSEDEWGTNYAGHFMIEAKKKGRKQLCF